MSERLSTVRRWGGVGEGRAGYKLARPSRSSLRKGDAVYQSTGQYQPVPPGSPAGVVAPAGGVVAPLTIWGDITGTISLLLQLPGLIILMVTMMIMSMLMRGFA